MPDFLTHVCLKCKAPLPLSKWYCDRCLLILAGENRWAYNEERADRDEERERLDRERRGEW